MRHDIFKRVANATLPLCRSGRRLPRLFWLGRRASMFSSHHLNNVFHQQNDFPQEQFAVAFGL